MTFFDQFSAFRKCNLANEMWIRDNVRGFSQIGFFKCLAFFYALYVHKRDLTSKDVSICDKAAAWFLASSIGTRI